MDERNSVLLVICNVPDADAARGMAETLLARQLAACVNVLPPVQSYYRWQGRIEHAVETTLLIKTTVMRYPALEAALQELHPYDVPEIIAVPVAAGLPAYLDWVNSETERDAQ
ncbi:MAG: divalent-cation tolerance protein CutA [Burkholderiales bacterium]|nr:divalent-cation tolerance protein CutA [Burkholderiales bacterium]